MGKRKHNQASTADGTRQADVSSSPKKAKVEREQVNFLSHKSPANSKSLVASAHPNRQASDTTQPPTKPEHDAIPGLSKSARKRLHKRKAFREAKKSHPDNKPEQATKGSGGQRPSQKPLTKPIPAEPKAPHTNAGSKPPVNGVSGDLKSEDSHVHKSRPPPFKSTASSKKQKSKPARSDSVRSEPTLHQSNSSAPRALIKPNLGANAGVNRKRERRRQKIALWKRAQASSHEPASKNEHKKLGENTAHQGESTLSAEGPSPDSKSPVNASILHQATQTTLLPVPKKQWIDETEQGPLVVDETLRKEATRTSLMPRPAKEWVEEDVPVQADNSVGDHLRADDGLQKNSADPIVASPTAAKLTTARSSSTSSAHSSPSSSPGNPQPKEVESPFAAVGLPPVTKQSITRPGINTIASFSLSSRRHPVGVLSKDRKISGLSGMRMDTGSIGSVNKPVSSLKASSVPSYSGRGDVKAAFAAFNKFAHGGESSDSDDESDESESEVEAQAQKPAASDTVAPVTTSSVSSEVRDPQNSQDGGAGQLDSTSYTDNSNQSKSSSSGESSNGQDAAVMNNDEVGGNHETQESEEYVAETPLNPTPNDPNTLDDAPDGIEDAPTQPIDHATRPLGQKDLPLFSDFKAKHDIQSTGDTLESPSTFLGQDLGGNISNSGPGPGPGVSPLDDNQRTISLKVPIGEYQASQEADELYRSIEDISREVFGSTRTLPDCKPPSNSLDVTTEHFVTESSSGHGVDLKLLRQKTPDKDAALRHIARGSSPMVYIVRYGDVDVETMPDIRRRLSRDERTTEIGPSLVSEKAEKERYSSPQSSLSTLTTSPTPPIDIPNLTQPTTYTANEDDDENNDDPTIDLGGHAVEGNEPVEATEKKRKMTGTSSRHFSPQKQTSKQRNPTIKPEPIDETKPSTLETCEEPPIDLPKPTKTKRKGTGKTSTFFTPTPSPTKQTPSTSSKTKSKTPRPPAGTSTCPVPPTTSPTFGLIQETLWHTPFWLLIAVVFLNKTAGRSAVPIFHQLRRLYPTPEDLAQADHEDLVELIAKLGLQNQRARKLVGIARTWCEDPPKGGRRWRCLHYPRKGDGKGYKKGEVIEDEDEDEEDDGGGGAADNDDDDDEIHGSLEIAHIPGLGPYAWDSWRIFCRDVLRGRAEDYNGKGSVQQESSKPFVPEWQRVLPLDKELRACLRWMWLREGWVWDCGSGAKRLATEEERRAGERGEMGFGGEGEREVAVVAAAAAAAAGGGDDGGDVDGDVRDGDGDLSDMDVQESGVVESGVDADHKDDTTPAEATPAVKKTAKNSRSRKMSIARRELDVVSGDEVGFQTLRRSRRTRTG